MTSDEHQPDDILNALRMGVNYTFEIRVRGASVIMRPLTISEHVEIVNRAVSETQNKPEGQRNQLTESSLLALYTLELASTPESVGTRKAMPRLPLYALNKMTNDEVIAFHRAYLAACETLDPALETIDQDQLLALIETAKKNTSELTRFSRRQLEAMATHFCSIAE